MTAPPGVRLELLLIDLQAAMDRVMATLGAVALAQDDVTNIVKKITSEVKFAKCGACGDDLVEVSWCPTCQPLPDERRYRERD